MALHTVTIASCIIVLAIGIFLYAMAMIKCIKQNLFAVSQSIRSETEIEQKLVWKQLIEYMEFDSSVKR